MAGFAGLTFTVQPVVLNSGALNTAGIPSGSVVAGILDPAGGINRMYNPTSVGFAPAGGDTAAHWLPATSAALTAASVLDNYWRSIPGQTDATVAKIGQVTMNLTAATADTVRASSVMSFKLSPNALVVLASGTF
jgi:hypothetical protein